MGQPLSRKPLSLSALGAVSLLAAALGQDARSEIVSPAEGFKIRDPGWIANELPPNPEADYALQLRRAGEKGERSLYVYVIDAGDAPDPRAIRDGSARGWRADRACSGVEEGEEKLAGETAYWVRLEKVAPATRDEITQHFLAHEGALFVIATVHPSGEGREELDALRSSFAFVPLADREGRAKLRRLRRLARRCGGEIDWARSWEEASQRAAREKKLVLVAVERYRGVPVEPCLPSTTFMDADVVALVRERFVALRWTGELDAPFLSPDVYGLGSFTFGQGILLATPGGQVVADAPSCVPTVVDQVAREALVRRPEATGAEHDASDPEVLLRRGELDAAARLLEHPDSARTWRLRGALLRRWRRGAQALEAFERARELGAPVALDEAVLELRRGRIVSAEDALEAALRARPDDLEARFWSLVARAARVGMGPVQGELEALAAEHPESPWAWRAAAMLVGRGIVSGLDPLAWPDEATIAATLVAPPAPAGPDDAARAADLAVTLLLESQRPDGGWASAFTLLAPRNPCDVAIASIAGLALLPRRDQADVAAVVSRALAHVSAAPLVPQPGATFDYTIWGQIFAIRLLARSGVRSARLAELVRALEREEIPGGGWSYFKVGTFDPPIGFVTAAALCALEDARAAGAAVPDALLERAASVLASLRRSDGGFDYLVGPNSANSAAEASLRGPLHALALARAGKAKPGEVKKALDLYLRHHEHVRAERGKSLCHTAPEGTASYYLLFGYAFAAEALGEIPAGDRAPFREALLEDVLATRAEDGSFVDSPAIGKAYGTATALLALELLASGRAR
jgi:hypothetical protein